MPLQHVGTGSPRRAPCRPGARQVRVKLRAVLVEESVPNVAFDDISLVMEEDATGGSGGQSAAPWSS